VVLDDQSAVEARFSEEFDSLLSYQTIIHEKAYKEMGFLNESKKRRFDRAGELAVRRRLPGAHPGRQ
jgi:hypothetical protein